MAKGVTTMSKHIRSTYSGYCPELDKQMSITVDFEEIQLLGEMIAQHKKTGYSCEHGSWEGCNSNGENGADCPIFKLAHM